MLCERLGPSLGQPGIGGEVRAQVLEQARAATRDRRVPAVRAGGPRRRADPARGLALPGVGQADQVGLVRPRLPGGGPSNSSRQAVATIRDGHRRGWASRSTSCSSQLQLPPEVSGVGGRACLAEEAATGAQVTVEGYSFQGDVHVYGTVDSITCPDSSSFLRYQYPSALPAAVTQRMAELSERVIRQIGLDGITFNIEYFWDADHDTISLLEVNPRHSQSHAELFEQVDGVANHDHMLQLALGREPRPRHREGPYDIAAKWFVRRAADGVARRVPTAEEIEQVERDHPGLHRRRHGHRGRPPVGAATTRTATATRSRTVYLGADDEDELIRKYEQALGGCRSSSRSPLDEGRGPATVSASHQGGHPAQHPAVGRHPPRRDGSGGPRRPTCTPSPPSSSSSRTGSVTSPPCGTRSTTPTSRGTGTPASGSTCAAAATPRACSPTSTSSRSCATPRRCWPGSPRSPGATGAPG